MLYTAGIGLVAERHPEEDRQSTRQGQPDSVLGPCNSQLVGKPAGVLSGAGGTQVPQRLPVRGRGQRQQQYPGSAHIIQGLKGHKASSGGGWAGGVGKMALQGALGTPCPSGCVCGGPHLPGKLREDEGCPVHVGVVVFQLHLFYLLLHQWLQGLPEVGALGTGVLSQRRALLAPLPGSRLPPPGASPLRLTGFLLHSMKPIWPLG